MSEQKAARVAGEGTRARVCVSGNNLQSLSGEIKMMQHLE